jgi:hypothetical protein
MREITARAYHVSRLDEDQVNILHDRETKLGYPGTPSEIRRKFRLSEIGQVPEELSEKPESQIVAIHEKTRAEYKKKHVGCCFKNGEGVYDKSDSNCRPNADLVVLHQTDWLIRDDRFLSLPTPTTGGKAREKMQGARAA